MIQSEKTSLGLHLIITDESNAETEDFIHQQIKEFNNMNSEHHRIARIEGPRPLGILIQNDRGGIGGGLIASTYWDWLDIDDLWVTEELRGQGLGREMLRMAEQEAIARGCIRVRLRTFSFQARGFYEKEGYRVVGKLEDYPPGETFYWMRKDFGGPEKQLPEQNN
jgi:GNAT superfamily N-acetyltransferase